MSAVLEIGVYYVAWNDLYLNFIIANGNVRDLFQFCIKSMWFERGKKIHMKNFSIEIKQALECQTCWWIF